MDAIPNLMPIDMRTGQRLRTSPANRLSVAEEPLQAAESSQLAIQAFPHPSDVFAAHRKAEMPLQFHRGLGRTDLWTLGLDQDQLAFDVVQVIAKLLLHRIESAEIQNVRTIWRPSRAAVDQLPGSFEGHRAAMLAEVVLDLVANVKPNYNETQFDFVIPKRDDILLIDLRVLRKLAATTVCRSCWSSNLGCGPVIECTCNC